MGPSKGEEVVISGISGIFPKSESVQQFAENLFNKVDMVSSENPRWVSNHYEIPKHLGVIDSVNKFDSHFFGIHYKQAFCMEPMSRKLLEHAYSAIYDAGINPSELRGKKVGVYVGTVLSESERINLFGKKPNAFALAGCNKTMFANRISYWMDSKGPSYIVDAACTSSMTCLEMAYRNIKAGLCDAAVVGGCNLSMHPNVTLNYKRAGFLCLDGKTKCFDKNSDGYVRSDAVCTILLQKAKDAKRIYAEVYHAKTNYCPKMEQFLPVRRPEEMKQFLEEFYSEIDVSPEQVEYVEANGAAIKEADINELQVIGSVFGKSQSVKVGCVKSNMGSSEPASGVCALAKACVAYHKGSVPGNINYEDPLDIPEVKDGKVQVLTDSTEFKRGFVAVNNFSFTGLNAHVLLKGHYKAKDIQKYKTDLPYLITVSGRIEECVSSFIENLKKSPIDPEEIGLLHNFHKYEISGHLSRGYAVLTSDKENPTVCLSESVKHYSGEKKPLWFLYSGMGSQWAGMGAQLMRIPIFAAAIQKCHKVLEPKGIDIVKIISDPDKTIFDNILHCFIGIAAVQIGLTDILKALGITPDYIIGHSAGELGCAYADGCVTAEEMILASYSRGLVSTQTPFIKGSMAAIGLGYKDILPLCPPEIEVACHNSSESSTISGPADVMNQFVSQLTSRGVFAKEVPCSNIAYHSKYIADAGPALLKRLSDVIRNPQLRSEKWVSTSVPRDRWDEPIAKYSSAEYHTNNLLCPVLFEESSCLIPNNAVVIEIAPHGLLQAIMKRSHGECVHVPLTRRGASDSVTFLLNAIGKLYEAGLNPDVQHLYPKIEYPVSTETPHLSHLVEWDHSEDWPEAKCSIQDKISAITCDFIVSIHDDDFQFLRGHVRGDDCVIPEAAYLVITWRTLAMYRGFDYNTMSVIFKDIQFHGEVNIKTEPLHLLVMIHKGNNRFEVTYENSTIVSGIIYIKEQTNKTNTEKGQDDRKVNTDSVNYWTNEDIYTMMGLNGYSFKDEFRSIVSMNSDRNKAFVKKTNNWILFLDSLIQLNQFARDNDSVSIPKMIRELNINVEEHYNTAVLNRNDKSCMEAELRKVYDDTVCGGVTITGITFTDLPSIEKLPDVLLHKEFIPFYFSNRIVDVEISIEVNLQIVSENVDKEQVKISDLTLKSKFIENVVKKASAKIFSADVIVEEFDGETLQDVDLVLVEDLLQDNKNMHKLHQLLPNEKFVLAVEDKTVKVNENYNLFNVITVINAPNNIIVLLRKKVDNECKNTVYLPVIRDNNSKLISRVKDELSKSSKVVLVLETEYLSEFHGVIRRLRQDHGNKIGCIFIDHEDLISFNPESNSYRKQIEKNLNFNVLRKGIWGGHYYISKSVSLHTANVILKASVPGDRESLVWVEKTTKETKNKVKVCYAGPTFADIEENQSELGTDFSGLNERGERVMGLGKSGAVACEVEADPDLLWPVPKHWSLEDAATVPMPYIYAYYCLAIRLRVPRNKIVFVNGDAGVIEQALIRVCLSLDCTVYTVVSDFKKKQFLLDFFPELNETNIATASDLLVNNMIKFSGSKRGCDLVINCLSGSLRKAALKCLSCEGSSFLDLNLHDMKDNQDFGMHCVHPIKNYYAVRIDSIFIQKYMDEKKELQKLLSTGIANGTVRPLHRAIYSQSNVCEAFKLLATRKYSGRVLIEMTNKDEVPATPQISYSSNGSYIVISDETVIGMELVDRLVTLGARNVTLQAKSNSLDGYCSQRVRSWKKQNASITIFSEDLQTETRCVKLLKKAAKSGTVLGIFIIQHSDSHIAKLNNAASIVSKLDLTSRNNCRDLKHFVVLKYSSKDSVSDDSMMSVVDNICESRCEDNLPALVYHARLIQQIDETENINTILRLQSLKSVFLSLEAAMKLGLHNVTTFNLRKEVSRLANKTEGYSKTNSFALNDGLHTVFTSIIADECLAAEPMIAMPTMFNKDQDEEDLDPTATYLMLMPGFEGHYEIFPTICEGLKVQAMALQYGPEFTDADIPEYAANILKSMKTRFVLNSKFYLLGYSFGVNVALELASLMEREGLVGVVYCLDSSPDALRTQLDALIGNQTESQLQNKLIKHMYKLMGGKDHAQLHEKLQDKQTWNDKVELYVQKLKTIVSYSHQYTKCLLQGSYNRLMVAKQYEPTFKLQSELVLMKAPLEHMQHLPADYGLSKYTVNKVRVFELSNDARVVTKDFRVTSIVNSLLESELLDAYNKKNLCLSYKPYYQLQII